MIEGKASLPTGVMDVTRNTLLCRPPIVQGALLQQLHPGATAKEARHLLAVVAAGGSGASSVTLPAVKATLARVQEAQQFPVSLGHGSR